MAGYGHNRGPTVDPEYVDYRHALQIAARDSDLPGEVKFLALVISTYMGNEAGAKCWPGLRLLAKITGIGVNKVGRLVKILSNWHLMTMEKSKGRRAQTYVSRMSYEQAIEIFCRNKRAEAATQNEGVVSPSRSDTNQQMQPVVSPSGRDTKQNDPVHKPVVSPVDPVCVTDEAVCVTALGGDRRQKKEDSLSEGPGGSESPRDGAGDNVVPLGKAAPGGDDPKAELQRSLNKVLGPFGQDTARALCSDMVEWSNGTPERALAELVSKVRIYGSQNVLEAWQSTTTRPSIKKPGAYFTKTLQGMLKEHGKHDLPEIEDQSENWSPAEYRRVKHGSDGLR